MTTAAASNSTAAATSPVRMASSDVARAGWYTQVVQTSHGPAGTVATFDNVLTTDQKGNIAEAPIVAAAVKLGIDVYKPVGEGGRYDMIFEVGTRLVRV